MDMGMIQTLDDLKSVLLYRELGKVERCITDSLAMNMTECTVEILNDSVRETIKKDMIQNGYQVKDTEDVIKTSITITL